MPPKINQPVTNLTHKTAFRPRLYFIVGPTAVGKTELSIRSAEGLQAEILSCDSLCVYQGMDIGTAKPGRSEQERVPHHGIDLVPVSAQFSVEAYQQYARQVVDDCSRRGRHVLVTGGSGFYLKSFFSPTSDGIEVPIEVVEQVRGIEADAGLSGLLKALHPYDSLQEAKLDRNNPRRVAKALERCLATGQRLIDLQSAFARLPDPWADYDKHLCLLEREPADLRQRIRMRIEQMFADGLVDEVRQLRREGIEHNPSAAGAIGYREVLAWLDRGGDNDLEELKASIAIHTDQLVRKQRIWFRRQIPIHNRLRAEGATPQDAFPDLDRR